MKDFLGNVLSIGDTVVMVAPGYRILCKGTVIAFTPQKVRIEYLNYWNYSSQPSKQTLLQTPDQVTKVN